MKRGDEIFVIYLPNLFLPQPVAVHCVCMYSLSSVGIVGRQRAGKENEEDGEELHGHWSN